MKKRNLIEIGKGLLAGAILSFAASSCTVEQQEQLLGGNSSSSYYSEGGGSPGVATCLDEAFCGPANTSSSSSSSSYGKPTSLEECWSLPREEFDKYFLECDAFKQQQLDSLARLSSSSIEPSSSSLTPSSSSAGPSMFDEGAVAVYRCNGADEIIEPDSLISLGTTLPTERYYYFDNDSTIFRDFNKIVFSRPDECNPGQQTLDTLLAGSTSSEMMSNGSGILWDGTINGPIKNDCRKVGRIIRRDNKLSKCGMEPKHECYKIQYTKPACVYKYSMIGSASEFEISVKCPIHPEYCYTEKDFYLD